MLQAIIGFFSSLPELIKLAKNIWAWLEKISGNDVAGFINRTNEAFTLLNKAKTEQEMIDAARAIQDAIRHTK